MEFILDTADLDAVKKLDELLTIAGVTTNPTIITKSGKSPEDVIRQFVDYLRPEQKFFVQVVSTEYQEMLDEARYICDLRPKNTYGLQGDKNTKVRGSWRFGNGHLLC